MAHETPEGQVNDNPVRPRGWGWRKAVLAVLSVAALAVLAAVALRALGAWPGRAADVVSDFPSGALDDYLPEDAAAVIALNLRQLADSPVGRRHLRQPLGQLIRGGQEVHPWAGELGVEPFADVERIEVVFSAGDLGRPLWLARGRFDPARFNTGPDQLREEVADDFRVYRYRAPEEGPVTTLGPAGDTLVVCNARPPVLAALRHAADPTLEAPGPPALKDMLKKVDRRQSLWLAMSFKKLGPIGTLSVRGVEVLLRPVFDNAQGVYGGIRCGADMSAEFHFRARDDKGARKLEDVLSNGCEVAQGLAQVPEIPGLYSLDRDLVPLFNLIGTGKVRRDGNNVSLTCRLPADQLGG